MSYERIPPFVTEKDIRDAKSEGYIVRLLGIRSEYYVYSIDGYKVYLRKRR